MAFLSNLLAAIPAYTGLSPVTFFTISAILIALYYLVSGIFAPSRPSAQQPVHMQPLPMPVQLGNVTEAELKAYDGSDPSKPLLMAIKGKVYDVSQSTMFYGPGGPYALFAGKDASRALAKMSFEEQDLNSNLEGLSQMELDALNDWEWKFMSKYVQVGQVVDGKEEEKPAQEAMEREAASNEGNVQIAHDTVKAKDMPAKGLIEREADKENLANEVGNLPIGVGQAKAEVKAFESETCYKVLDLLEDTENKVEVKHIGHETSDGSSDVSHGQESKVDDAEGHSIENMTDLNRSIDVSDILGIKVANVIDSQENKAEQTEEKTFEDEPAKRAVDEFNVPENIVEQAEIKEADIGTINEAFDVAAVSERNIQEPGAEINKNETANRTTDVSDVLDSKFAGTDNDNDMASSTIVSDVVENKAKEGGSENEIASRTDDLFNVPESTTEPSEGRGVETASKTDVPDTGVKQSEVKLVENDPDLQRVEQLGERLDETNMQHEEKLIESSAPDSKTESSEGRDVELEKATKTDIPDTEVQQPEVKLIENDPDVQRVEQPGEKLDESSAPDSKTESSKGRDVEFETASKTDVPVKPKERLNESSASDTKTESSEGKRIECEAANKINVPDSENRQPGKNIYDKIEQPEEKLNENGLNIAADASDVVESKIQDSEKVSETQVAADMEDEVTRKNVNEQNFKEPEGETKGSENVDTNNTLSLEAKVQTKNEEHVAAVESGNVYSSESRETTRNQPMETRNGDAVQIGENKTIDSEEKHEAPLKQSKESESDASQGHGDALAMKTEGQVDIEENKENKTIQTEESHETPEHQSTECVSDAIQGHVDAAENEVAAQDKPVDIEESSLQSTEKKNCGTQREDGVAEAKHVEAGENKAVDIEESPDTLQQQSTEMKNGGNQGEVDAADNKTVESQETVQQQSNVGHVGSEENKAVDTEQTHEASQQQSTHGDDHLAEALTVQHVGAAENRTFESNESPMTLEQQSMDTKNDESQGENLHVEENKTVESEALKEQSTETKHVDAGESKTNDSEAKAEHVEDEENKAVDTRKGSVSLQHQSTEMKNDGSQEPSDAAETKSEGHVNKTVDNDESHDILQQQSIEMVKDDGTNDDAAEAETLGNVGAPKSKTLDSEESHGALQQSTEMKNDVGEKKTDDSDETLQSTSTEVKNDAETKTDRPTNKTVHSEETHETLQQQSTETEHRQNKEHGDEKQHSDATVASVIGGSPISV